MVAQNTSIAARDNSAGLSSRAVDLVKAVGPASADHGFMFAFFSNRLGCLGSIIVSVAGSALLIFLLRGCGSGL